LPQLPSIDELAVRENRIVNKYGLLILATLLLVSGCAETRYALRYETSAEEKVWPSAPDIPRYRYVGQLTGEENLKALNDSGAGAAVKRFFKALVGLGSDNEQVRSLLRPQSGVIDRNGRILVTDAGRQGIFVFDEKQGELQVWVAADDEYNFISPVGIAIANNGDVLVADAELHRVIRLDAMGKPKSEFGFEDLERPTGLAIDPDTSRVFVADTGEHNIKVYTDAGKLVQIIGQVGVKPGEFNAPTHLAFANGQLYVTDTFNARVQVFDAEGKFLRLYGERGLYLGNLVRPKGVTVDSEGNVYIIESFHDYLLVYDKDTRFLLPIGGTGSGVGQFYLPAGVWSDDHDRIYVADMYNGRVVIFQYLQGKGRGAAGSGSSGTAVKTDAGLTSKPAQQ
jgi:DNA-binding beta-propeller fold protein YncE